MLNFIKDYWTQITVLFSFIIALSKFMKYVIEATKCSLRNDILDIYDRCKNEETITYYQLESIEHSYAIYKKLHGNSFVTEIVNKAKKFKLVD